MHSAATEMAQFSVSFGGRLAIESDTVLPPDARQSWRHVKVLDQRTWTKPMRVYPDILNGS